MYVAIPKIRLSSLHPLSILLAVSFFALLVPHPNNAYHLSSASSIGEFQPTLFPLTPPSLFSFPSSDFAALSVLHTPFVS